VTPVFNVCEESMSACAKSFAFDKRVPCQRPGRRGASASAAADHPQLRANHAPCISSLLLRASDVRAIEENAGEPAWQAVGVVMTGGVPGEWW
jgi:hypothetical protein